MDQEQVSRKTWGFILGHHSKFNNSSLAIIPADDMIAPNRSFGSRFLG